MSEKENKTTAKKVLDTVVISSLSSLVASVIGAVAFMVYNQAQTATEDIKEIKAKLEVIQESSIEEIAVLKAELKTSNQRFKEVSELLQKEHEFHLPNSPTYDDIKEQEDDLRNQFDPIQQQLPPDVGGRNGID